MRQMFGVCANEWSPSDGKVVSLDHGCGAHSQTDVPSMPSDWPDEALKAQAVAARSYAIRHLRPERSFDVIPSNGRQSDTMPAPSTMHLCSCRLTPCGCA